MTIPIIPGPFSFLAGAGEALGAYGTQREEHRRYAQDTARKALEHWDNLVQIGIFPAKSMQSPEYGHLTDLAGFGAAPTGPILPQPREMRAEDIAGMTGTKRAIALQEPTAADVAEADVTAKALEGLTSEQARAYKKVPGKEEAALGERQRTAEAQLGIDQAKMTEDLVQGAQELMGASPFTKKLAEESVLGILQYRMQRLTLNRQLWSEQRQAMADRARITTEHLSNISREYLKKSDEYAAQMRNDMFQAGIDSSDPQAVAKYVQAYQAGNPPPTRESVQADYLASAGLTLDQFKAMNREMAGFMAEAESDQPKGGAQGTGTPAPGAKGTAAPGTAAPGGAPPPSADTQGQMIRETISFSVTADPVVAGQTLQQILDQDVLQESEILYILQNLRQQMPAAQYEKLKNAYDQAKVRSIAGPPRREAP